MSFRALRESRHLSQEKLAELTGLSLRTVKRAEAGHRVSYASLRALAAAFEMDVDQLERELYAMGKSAEDFVEVPRWVRLWMAAHSPHGLHASRRQVHIAEAICMGGGLVFLVASFLLKHEFLVTLFRVAAAFQFAVGYLLSLTIRIIDTYRLWPATEVSAWAYKPVRTLRGTAIEYGFVLVVVTVFLSLVFWL